MELARIPVRALQSQKIVSLIDDELIARKFLARSDIHKFCG
jgi:hypothetical protein